MTGIISGLHHVTAIAGPPQPNLDFYTGLLGMRLVKQTVNYDDPETYHLYYGDARGRPGTMSCCPGLEPISVTPGAPTYSMT